ncbi:serine-rich adhesin for platelets-like [Lucilia sericata]|uniref:serine-rich adhesin for platelets-like n=1 Tax=Lucilia sericata TaxID=13632 RepID=UPI0018A8100D|nr:serine-rich adhesin for platelets-like [Lucilia sericata]
MSKIYKQMLNNRIIQIIVITWLIQQQQQLTMCIAAWQPLQALATNPALKLEDGVQVQQKQHHVRDDILHNSTSISNSSTTTTTHTTAVAAANNKLNVNNTDTQMTLKLKDATARNVYTKYYNKTLLLAPVTKTENNDSSKRTSTNIITTTNKPTKPAETVKISVKLTSTTETFADGQLSTEIIGALETQTTNNAANNQTNNPNHHHHHHNNTPALLNITHFTSNITRPYIKLKRKTLITMTTAAPDIPKLSSTATRKTVAKVNVKNEIRDNTEKGLNSRILKDLPGKYVEKAAAFVDLIEKDKNQLTANEDSSSTTTTRAQKLHKKLEEEKGVQMEEKVSVLKEEENEDLAITLKDKNINENNAFAPKASVIQEHSLAAFNLSSQMSKSKDKESSQEESKAAQLSLETLDLLPPKSLSKNIISKELTGQSISKMSHTKAIITKALEEQELYPESLSLETQSSVSKGKNFSSDNIKACANKEISSKALQVLSKSNELINDTKDVAAEAPELSLKVNNQSLDSESKNLYGENTKAATQESYSETLKLMPSESGESYKDHSKSFLKVIDSKPQVNFNAKMLRSQKLDSRENTKTAAKEKLQSETFLSKQLEHTNKDLGESFRKGVDHKALQNTNEDLSKQSSNHENKDLVKSFPEVVSYQNLTGEEESSQKSGFKGIKLSEQIEIPADLKANTESLEKESNEKALKLLQPPTIDEIKNITDINNQKLKLTTIKANRQTLAKQKQHSLSSTFQREKRFKTKILNPENITQTLANLTKPQIENNTESSHDYTEDNTKTEQQHMAPTAITDTITRSKIESLTPNHTKSIIVVENKKQNKSRNESVELETADERKLKFTDEQKQLAINTTTAGTTATTKGNGNNMTAIENKMNNKQLAAKERQSKDDNKNENIQLIDEEHVVSEINGINTMMTTAPTGGEEKTTTTSKTYLITTPTTVVETSATAVAKQILLESPTTLAQPITTTTLSTSSPFSIFTESLQNTTVANSFSTTNGPLSIHDLVNTRLNTVSIDSKTIPTTYTTTTLMQLVSTTSTATLPPFSYNSTLTTSLTSPPPSLSSLVSSASSAAATSMSSLYSNNFATTSTTTTPSWPVKHASVMEGNVILGGLMMVHSREDSITCGPIMPQGGIQALEAMLYTLDQVNKQQLLPNITLGAHILDDCDKDTYGLEMAVDFIKGK